MIHNSFFSPYPLQTILNAIREYLYGDRLVITGIYTPIIRKGHVSQIFLYDCRLYDRAKKRSSRITLINRAGTAYISAGYMVFLFGRAIFVNQKTTFDLDGKSVSLRRFLPTVFMVERCEKDFTGAISKKLPRNDKNHLRVDDQNFRGLTSGLGMRSVGWNYDIDLIKNSASHVISLDMQGSGNKPRPSIFKGIQHHGKRIQKNWNVLRHSLRRAFRRPRTQ